MKKVIIIGAGNIGKAAFEFLGTEFVECFADNVKKGTDFLGKKVIPVDDLAMIQKKFVILLAMTNYVNELKVQLAELGIKNYFHFTESIYFFDGLKQWQFRTVYEKYALWKYYNSFELQKSVIIGKHTMYSEFLSELFGIEIISENESYKNFDKYLFNMDGRQICDFIRRHGNIAKENIFALPQTEDAGIKETHKELEIFKNKHEGKRCFIIGNGPSLRIEDLDRLSECREICFGLNVIHKLYKQTKWRPDYVCMTDPLVIAQNYKAIKRNNSCPKIVNDIKLFYHWETDHNEYLVHERTDKIGFSDQLCNGYYGGATVTYAVMQLCAYMGFAEIYLLGMDCSNWGKHFDECYWEKDESFRAPDEMKILQAYQEAERYSRRNGFRIFNATRGGKLEVYERVDFDLFLDNG